MRTFWVNSFLFGLAFCSFLSCGSRQQEKYITSCSFPEGATIGEKVRMAAHVVPSERQLEWQKMEKTCFICYGINTFTGKEWGTGKEDPRFSIQRRWMSGNGQKQLKRPA
ncbi:hypothetical protein [Parabacteroides sp. AM58-2XD]|uniref:hypothetical protein n=1 Tax=Parabacteroides sp. AM58-2XD TaxID=2292362 RepID=UPI000FE22097|nr:hypothetical protein [Parabacteroides sp. AM58-2XD]